MAKYRNNLPQISAGKFISDGGMETSLIFNQGQDLPHFAAFVLLETDEGRTELTHYYEQYLDLARARNVGFVLDAATWRANPDWGYELGFDLKGLKAINEKAVRYVDTLRKKWEATSTPIVLSGVIGPRGDGYKAGRMDPAEAEEYHSFQVGVFAGTETDIISAMTMNTVNEAVGIARAAKAFHMPCVISFTVETDGRLVDGTSLRTAIETTEEATNGSPVYYMINCAHPTHFEKALMAGESWVERIQGVRANASTKSHAELDESETLDVGDIADLGRRYQSLAQQFPHMRVFGGCCGTDHRHLAAICEAFA